MDNINKAFGKHLRKLRTDRKLSQEELAFYADLHRTYIGQIERGEKNITLKNLEKIANSLSISLKDLMDFEKDNGKELKK